MDWKNSKKSNFISKKFDSKISPQIYKQKVMGQWVEQPELEGKKTIHELAKDNPIINTCYEEYRRIKDFTWEQCLVKMIYHLAQGNKHLQDELIKERQNRPPAPIIIKRED